MNIPQIGMYSSLSQLGTFLATVIGYFSFEFNKPKNSFYIPVIL